MPHFVEPVSHFGRFLFCFILRNSFTASPLSVSLTVSPLLNRALTGRHWAKVEMLFYKDFVYWLLFKTSFNHNMKHPGIVFSFQSPHRELILYPPACFLWGALGPQKDGEEEDGSD